VSQSRKPLPLPKRPPESESLTKYGNRRLQPTAQSQHRCTGIGLPTWAC